MMLIKTHHAPSNQELKKTIKDDGDYAEVETEIKDNVMLTSKQKAQKKYAEKRVGKSISFNLETEKELHEFANSVDLSNWVKQKIKENLKVI